MTERTERHSDWVLCRYFDEKRQVSWVFVYQMPLSRLTMFSAEKIHSGVRGYCKDNAISYIIQSSLTHIVIRELFRIFVHCRVIPLPAKDHLFHVQYLARVTSWTRHAWIQHSIRTILASSTFKCNSVTLIWKTKYHGNRILWRTLWMSKLCSKE